MKNKILIFALLSSFFAFIASSCNQTTKRQITMTLSNNVETLILLAGEGSATIDWGDGTVVETDELTVFDSYTFEGAQEYRHEYASSAVRKITITGNVTMLMCNNAGLTALDVSKNPTLMHLYCNDNQLTALDVSRNSLRDLSCFNNRLTALDVSNSPGLETLVCNANQLTALDVSHNTVLEYFNCTDNQLTALDLSHNTALHAVIISNNKFTANALNAMFETLHSNLVMGEGGLSQWYRFCDNPGSADCDTSIAKAKGWTVQIGWIEEEEEVFAEDTIFDEVEFMQKVKNAIAENNKKWLANYIRYPLNTTLNGQEKIIVENRQQFIDNFEQIFYPAYKEQIEKHSVNNLFSNWQGTMLGNGEIWISENNVIAINN